MMHTVIVGRSSSTCSACGGNATPSERSHISGGPSASGYSAGSSLSDKNGCGVVWDDLESSYVYPDSWEIDLKVRFWGGK